MEKHYRFADVELSVQISDDRMYTNDLTLKKFRTDHVTDPHCYEVTVVSEIPQPEGPELAVMPGVRIYEIEGGYSRYLGPVELNPESAYTRAIHRGKQHEIQVKDTFVNSFISARVVLNSLDVEHLVASAGGLILHGACINYNGKAIVFTAPSGTGKSTQAQLWMTHRNARIINGDRIVLMEKEGQFFAAGLPFAGSSEYCENETLPLAAVVYLRQAPVTSIRTLRNREAFRSIWEGCSINAWNRDDTECALKLIEKLLMQLSVYELACTPDESAVDALEFQLRKQGEL